MNSHGFFSFYLSRRGRYLATWAPFLILSVAVAVSCVRHEDFPAGITAGSGSGSLATSGASGSGVSSGASNSGTSTGPSCSTTAAQLVSPLSVDQKSIIMAGQPSGCQGGVPNLSNIFTTPGILGAGIKGIKFRDGPRGVCLAANLLTGQTGYSTVFPVASARGATFDIALEKQIGADMGDEMMASSHNLILAPVINILRHPAWGRAQETYGEDSFLLGTMGSAYIQGAQQYVPACAKHFAANNIEFGRANAVAIMDEQTLHEIYGRHFEMAVQDGGVACIMASYNFLQTCTSITPTPTGCNAAAHATENPELLTAMLRNTFGFTGFVLTDWWALPVGLASCPAAGPSGLATLQIHAAEGVNAGLDMEMPWWDAFTQLSGDVTAGTVKEALLTTAAQRIVTQQCRFNLLKGNGLATSIMSTFDSTGGNINDPSGAHNADAKKAAVEGMVLLKNASATMGGPTTLPINKTTYPNLKTVAVIGATVPFSLGSAADIANGMLNFVTNDITGNGSNSPTHLTGDLGSSRVYPDPARYVGPLAGIQKAATAIGVNNVVSGSTAAAVGNADFVIVMAGTTPEDEGEEYTGAADRLSFMLDDKAIHVEHLQPVQNPLIQAVAALGKPMAVVLEAGSVIDMPWLSSVPAVVMAWYGGQDVGDALGELLFGTSNFSGKLPVTWPNPSPATCAMQMNCPATGCPGCYGDEPQFAGSANRTVMDYYLGYRFYDHNGLKPLFPLGFGLSYTTFQYGALTMSATSANKTDTVMVTVPVKNTGTVAGDEVSFLFVSYPNTKRTGRSSPKELKGFTRTPNIMPGTTAMVQIPLRVSDLKYWDATANGGQGAWANEVGSINIMVGGSSDALTATGTLNLNP